MPRVDYTRIYRFMVIVARSTLMETAVSPIADYRVRVEHTGQSLEDETFRREWLALLEDDSTNDRHFATPQWTMHRLVSGLPITLISIAGENGTLAGLGSFRLGTFGMRYSLKKMALWTRVFRAEHVMAMLLPADDQAADRLFAAMRNDAMDNSDCIHFESVWVGSKLWSYLQRSPEIQSNWFRYCPNPPANCHYIELPMSFEIILEKVHIQDQRQLKKGS